MAYIEMNEELNFDELIAEGVTILDFYAEWCGPCKMIAPVFEKLSKEMTDVKFVKVNVDNFKEISLVKYDVKSIPTLIILKDGEIVEEKKGFIPEPALKEWIESKR